MTDSGSPLFVYLGSVFAGLTAVLAILGFVYNPLVLLVAAAFGATTYVLWYHGTGRLGERVARERAGRWRSAGADPGRGGFGAGPRESWTGPRRGDRAGGRTRVGATTGPGTGAGVGPGAGPGAGPGERQRGRTAAESYRILGLEPGADPEAVQSAYRERVKEAHPDTEGGSEDEFKRVKGAYERLTD